ncbi:hypothetical protein GUJ93_ZPchr0015g6645 [Zizania palustris]|uniref:Uncharacterized protein n=1 Tax=Zizania palustris TaxID=103762 RepID=A0A8J5SYN3_ZIZPA|nr:hypothetical protein GUJ93_ZPchr0015g6645 [Zizania palustris]
MWPTEVKFPRRAFFSQVAPYFSQSCLGLNPRFFPSPLLPRRRLRVTTPAASSTSARLHGLPLPPPAFPASPTSSRLCRLRPPPTASTRLPPPPPPPPSSRHLRRLHLPPRPPAASAASTRLPGLPDLPPPPPPPLAPPASTSAGA